MSILSKVPLFAALGRTELEEVEKHASARTYPKNTVVVSQGDASTSLYVIVSGEVKVFLSDNEGKEVIINSQGPGEYFGELALIGDGERSASIMTTEKSTFCVITQHDFREVLAKHPDIALTLIKDLTHRVRLLTDNIKSLALLDVYGRVAKALLGLAVKREDKLIIEEKLTQQDLASRVGASREMVSRILKDLSSGGYISIESKRIIIHDKLPERY